MLSSLHVIHDWLFELSLGDAGLNCDGVNASLCGREGRKRKPVVLNVQDLLNRVVETGNVYPLLPDITIYSTEKNGDTWTIRYTKQDKGTFTIDIHAASPYFKTDNGVDIIGIAHLHMILRQNTRTA